MSIEQQLTDALTQAIRAKDIRTADVVRMLKTRLQERRTAKVESAMPLAPELQTRVRNSLTRLHGEGLSFLFRVDPGLIGGLRIQVGSDVYDGSVQAGLAALERSL